MPRHGAVTGLLVLGALILLAACSEPSGHTHAGFEIPTGEAIPTVGLVAVEDPISGWNLKLTTTNFSFAPQRAGREVVLGEGHAHLYVDGEKLDRLYGPWYHLAGLTPGRHTIEVTLNGNDHAVYQVNGESIGAAVTIESTDRKHTHTAETPLEADETMTVALRVVSDPVGGWNVFVDTTGFTWAPEHAGLTAVAGEGHAHLYVDDQKLGRIYGSAFYLPSLDPGLHNITVSLHGNNHAPYHLAGESVAATIPVEVDGEARQAERTVAIVVRAGKVVGGAKSVDVTHGEVIELTVEADTQDSLHVHGYELVADVGPNRDALLVFPATIRGVFDVELEQKGLLILQFTVR